MEALQTPYFIIDEAILQKYYHMLTDSLRQSWGNYLIGYSFKTNSLPWLISFVKKNGAYAEVVSEDEYLLARHLGYQNQEIIYNGPYKSEHSFREVLLASGCVNLDSQLELTWLSRLASEYPGQTFSVGIRANFDLEKMCPGETTMGEVSGRFGFCYESGRFAEALQMCPSSVFIYIPAVNPGALRFSVPSRKWRVSYSRNLICPYPMWIWGAAIAAV